MLTYVVRRIALSIPVLLIASIAVFVFVHETTDPLARFSQLRDPNTRTAQALRLGIQQQPCHTIHLNVAINGSTTDIKKCSNTPVFTQYSHWLNGFVHGRMGTSFVNGQSVSGEIRDRFKNTLQLIFFGVLISAILAIGIGVYSAVRQYSLLDYTFTGLSFVGLSMPAFWFGLISIQIFSFQFKQWFHLKGPLFYSIGIHSGAGAGTTDYFRHLALPVLTLTVQIIASWSRYQRSSMLDVMSADYIRTAKAKGLPRWKVIGKHALRNALIPLVTVMAVDIGALFGGLIITEKIFAWPGMGALFVDALENGDTNVLLPWLMVAASFIILFNLLADVLYGTLDPRVRLA